MDTAPDLGNPPETLTALEKEILRHFGYAVVFGIVFGIFLLFALAAWNAIFMATTTAWWATTAIVAGAAALNQLVKVAQGVKQAVMLLSTRDKP